MTTMPLLHPPLPPIFGFHWKRIREDDNRDGRVEATTLLLVSEPRW